MPLLLQAAAGWIRFEIAAAEATGGLQALQMQEGFSGGMLHEVALSDPEIDEGLGLWLPQRSGHTEFDDFDF